MLLPAVFFFLFLHQITSQEQDCTNGNNPGVCQFCTAKIYSSNPSLIHIYYHLPLITSIPLDKKDWSVTIQSQTKTITSVTYQDDKTIDILFAGGQAAMHDTVLFSYTHNEVENLQVKAKQNQMPCDGRPSEHVINMIISPEPAQAWVFDVTPNQVLMQWDVPLDTTPTLIATSFVVETRVPSGSYPDLVHRRTTTSILYEENEKDKIRLTFDGPAIHFNDEIISIIYSGTEIKSSDGVLAGPIKTLGRLHEGFPADNNVLSPKLTFSSEITCYPYMRLQQLNLIFSKDYHKLDTTKYSLNDLLPYFDITDQAENDGSNSNNKLIPTSIEQIGTGNSPYMLINFQNRFKSGQKILIKYTRPPRGSPFQILDAGEENVLSNFTSYADMTSIDNVKPELIGIGEMMIDTRPGSVTFGQQITKLILSESLDLQTGSPTKSSAEKQDFVLHLNGNHIGKKWQINSKSVEFCEAPQACIYILWQKNITHADTIKIYYSSNMAHRSDGIYDVCGNQLSNFDGAGIPLTNNIPKPTTTTTTTTTIAPLPSTPSPSFQTTSTTTTKPFTPTTTTVGPSDSSKTTSSGTVNDGDGTGNDMNNSNGNKNTVNGTNNNGMILWIVAGSIIGMIIGCGCIFLCCPNPLKQTGRNGSNSNARRRKKSKKSRKQGKGRIGTRHAVDSGFGSFKDGPIFSDEEDDDDIEMLSSTTLSTASKIKFSDDEFYNDEFDEDDFDAF